MTVVPEVLSFREFRAGLAATLKRVQEPGAGPVFVGAHRRPEAVVLSAAEYERLRGRAGRREAVDAALASVRAEGLEPSEHGLDLLEAMASGRLDADEAVAQLLAPLPPVSWDPYLDLEHGVLRNQLGLTDRVELARVEAGATAMRLAELETHDLPGHYDLTHLQAFHRHLFGDVYDWAGELRTVSIGKGMLFCLPQHLRSSGEALFVQLARRQYLRGLDRTAFVDDLAGFLGELNALHPFREGNGRTQRAFCGQLARTAGHPVRWALLDGGENVLASKAAHAGDLDPLRAMLDRLVR